MFGFLSVWVFELELVNVANVKISSSNVANFQLGIGIGIGNISTLATFTSVELEIGTTDLHGQGFAYARQFGADP